MYLYHKNDNVKKRRNGDIFSRLQKNQNFHLNCFAIN